MSIFFLNRRLNNENESTVRYKKNKKVCELYCKGIILFCIITVFKQLLLVRLMNLHFMMKIIKLILVIL